MREDFWIVDPSLWAADRVVADLDAIRRYNPQRFEMEQLSGIVYEDAQRHICVGYKDLTRDAFWARGQRSSTPAMPGILMCEAAAQLANYYALKHKLCAIQGALLGLKDVRCRRLVTADERLFVLVKLLKVRGAVLTFQFQCAVRRQLACDGVLRGGVFSFRSIQRPQQG
jgi:3-hydroxyacyl-[acyl-carrier-protein] dehydratase